MTTPGTAFEREWRARFERFGRTGLDEATLSGWSALGLRRRVSLFRELLGDLRLSPGASVLDVGCGPGTYVRLLAGDGCRVIGLDYSFPTLVRALETDRGKNGAYVSGEAYRLPFRAKTFDLVVSIGVLQTLALPGPALDEMSRVLRPGGTLVVEALNGRAMPTRLRETYAALRRRRPRVRTYDPAQVRAWLAERGFVVTAQVAVCLPPRRLQRFDRLFPLGSRRNRLAQRPRVAALIAHSFLFVARKDGAVPREGHRR